MLHRGLSFRLCTPQTVGTLRSGQQRLTTFWRRIPPNKYCSLYWSLLHQYLKDRNKSASESKNRSVKSVYHRSENLVISEVYSALQFRANQLFTSYKSHTMFYYTTRMFSAQHIHERLLMDIYSTINIAPRSRAHKHTIIGTEDSYF